VIIQNSQFCGFGKKSNEVVCVAALHWGGGITWHVCTVDKLDDLAFNPEQIPKSYWAVLHSLIQKLVLQQKIVKAYAL
jgi:hypothetical protein